LYVNKSFLEFFGIEESTVIGKTDFDWLPRKTAKHFADNDQYVRSSGKTLETIEESNLHEGLIRCLVHKFPIEDSSGRKLVAGIATNISERLEMEDALKRATQELSLARDQALELSALKSSFVTNVSHELLTPLTGILAAVELLTKTSFNQEQLSLLKIAEESSQALLALVNNILDLSKIEAGKMDIEIETFDLASLIHGCINGMSLEAQGKKLAITSKIDSHIPKTVQGDKQRVRQTLLNLISNGIKFTEEGKVTVEAHLEQNSSAEASHTAKIRFDVKDTGIGISEEEQHLLFKPFSQIDASTTRKHQGAGVGLYISKQLVNIMGGTITIKSTKGKGTTCSFVIPFKTCINDEEMVAPRLTQVSNFSN
jgi:two-component system, sensor histidine kinase and response regulator